VSEQGSEPAEADMDTGPIQLPDDPASPYGGLESAAGFDEVPTPPSGYPAAWPHAVSPLLPPTPLAPPPPAPPAPAAAAPPPSSLPPLGSPRTERDSVVALFLVHMFPIGHLPVAADKPALQLPLPAGAASLGPFAHPDMRLLVDDQALTNVTAGFRRSPIAPPRDVPPEVTFGYDPYARATESAWERRFITDGPDGPDYVWPPFDAGAPIMLESDTFLDHLGPPYGRVFFRDRTQFSERGLPPGWLEEEYRRYRVVRRVPMWRAEAAQWFGQPGGGTRYRAPLGADELVTLGYLAEVKGED